MKWARRALGCLAGLGLVCSASAAEIRVMASTGVSAMFQKLIPPFEASSGHKVNISYDTSNIIMRKIAAGEVADVVVLTAPLIEQLAQQGKVTPGSRKDLARSGIGVAARAGHAAPDISSVEALRLALLQARSVAYTATGASGIYFAGLTERLGIAPQVRAKAITPAGGIVAELVAKGEAELCVQMVSELQGVPGTVFLGPLPKEVQMYTVFSAALMASSPESPAARAWLEFLTTPASLAVYVAAGMEP
jgi:molybdate transport system substrate-binding protein